MGLIIKTCILLHNMVGKDEGDNDNRSHVPYYDRTYVNIKFELYSINSGKPVGYIVIVYYMPLLNVA